MSGQVVVPKKKRGPVPTGKGVQVQVRFQPDLLTAIDKFTTRDGIIGRPEAIRLILRRWLSENGMLPD